MYLINVQTMQLEQFQDDRDLVYAILSHRWQEEEVLFQDMQTGEPHKKVGYVKLKRFCDEAAAGHYTYAWCDTCCIDKSSSAELSESINSMFRWYQNSVVCYAYLYDVTTSDVDDNGSDFSNSVWFSRGWCLQELLASKALTIFEWKSLGTKEQLSQIISKVTGIHHEALCGRDLQDYSIAQRMSWASDRVTTRVGDIAYSLLGIFGVNMPLLYGDGERAFTRLQEEIMKQSSDQSILVHSSRSQDQRLLALSPADFRDSSNVVQSDVRLIAAPYNLTNIGLSIEFRVCPWSLEVYIALLDCRDELEGDDHIGIFVKLQPQILRVDGSPSTDLAARVKINGQAWIRHPPISKLPCVQNHMYLGHVFPASLRTPPKRYGFWIRRFERITGIGQEEQRDEGKLWAVSWNQWDATERIVEIPDGIYGTAGIVLFDPQHSPSARMVLRLAFTSSFEPIIEFNGNNSIYRSNEILFGSSGTANGLIEKEKVLSDTSWMKGYKSQGNTFWNCARDSSIQFRTTSGDFPRTNFSLEKVQVNGIETWAVDIIYHTVY